MDLSIIIVNWNSKDYLRKCLASIRAETRGLDYEIIVIDSASYDGCDRMLREELPSVRFIQSTANLGFARANNQAFAVSRGNCVLFLNPDTELRGPAINILYEALQSRADAGVVGARLLNSDGTLQTSCVQAFPTILNQLLNVEAIRRRFPRSRLWGTTPLFDGTAAPSDVDAISGACLMMRRSLFEQVGGFSTDYFMYSEDVELCLKARRAGQRNYYVPGAEVVHHGGGSSAQSPVSAFSSVMMLESRWRFFRKTRSPGYGWLYRMAMLASSLVRLTVAILLWPVGRLTAQSQRWTAALQTWSARLRWTLGLEGWVRNY